MLARPALMSARLPFRSVTSRHNPLVSRFRMAARRDDPDDLVLIEGDTLMHEAAQAGWSLVTVVAADDWLAAHSTGALDALGGEVDCVAVPRAVLEALSPAASPSGVVALARRPAAAADPFAGGVPLVAMADDVQDPGNLGAVARAAEAAGATGMFACGRSADPFGWKALRGGMGSLFRLPIVTCPAAEEAVSAVRARGLRVLALTARDGRPLYDVDLRGPSAILVGGEGPGLSADAAAMADTRVTIPMRPPVESLNVAVAAAIALYEAARQRSAG
jgi:TrmH family RNA methyltransferase